MAPTDILRLILVLLAVAVLLARAAERLRLPPAALYVLGGMAIALTPGPAAVALDPDLTLILFLPPLLQASAFFTVWRDFRRNLFWIALLAVGAVIFTTFALGAALHWLQPDLPWAVCVTFGAIMSPPDAVSAGAVLERLRIPRRLLTVLEGESLINDATGLTMYQFALAAAGGAMVRPGHAALTFGWLIVAGVAVGYVCGRGSTLLFRWLATTPLVIATSFLAAWTSYILADAIGGSGVLATVACGIAMGWYQHGLLDSRSRLYARATWGFVVFVLEALVFILIGLSLRGVLDRLGPNMIAVLPLAAAMAAAMIVSRFVYVFPAVYLPRILSPALRRRDPPPRLAIPIVISWAGMRGVVSLAVALSLPDDFPGHDLIIVLTFSLILVTVLLQGMTLGPLIQMLGLTRGAPMDEGAPPEHLARSEVRLAELRLIEQRASDPLAGAIARDLVAEFQDRAGYASRSSRGGAAARAEHDARISLRLEAVAAGRQRLLAMHRAGEIHDETLAVIEEELDLTEIRHRSQAAH